MTTNILHPDTATSHLDKVKNLATMGCMIESIQMLSTLSLGYLNYDQSLLGEMVRTIETANIHTIEENQMVKGFDQFIFSSRCQEPDKNHTAYQWFTEHLQNHCHYNLLVKFKLSSAVFGVYTDDQDRIIKTDLDWSLSFSQWAFATTINHAIEVANIYAYQNLIKEKARMPVY